MNIWIFNHYATTPDHVGGTRHYDLASLLVKRGHKVTIIASSFNHFLKRETRSFKNKILKRETINGVNFIWINTLKYNKAIRRGLNIIDYTIKSYFTMLKELKYDRPDLIIGSSVHPLAALVGYLISKKSGAIYYFEERDLWPQTFVDFGKLSIKNPIVILLYKFEKFLYKKARRIIVLFDKAPKYVESRNINIDKVIYLPNGVNMKSYKQLQLKREDCIQLQQSKFKVIYTGSHGLANDLEPLIETANILQKKFNNHDIDFYFIGDGALKNDLIKKAKKMKLENITFMKPVSKDRIPRILMQADLSIISIAKSPLYKWGFSMNKMYDYMAAKLPVMIHTDRNLIGELGEVNGINVSETPLELAHDIVRLVNNDQIMTEMGTSLFDHAMEKYSWDVLSLKLEEYMLKDLEEVNKVN